MSLSFKKKPGGLYVTAKPNMLCITLADRPRIPVGTRLLVIEPVPSTYYLPGYAPVYRVLIDGSVGIMALGEGDVLPVEEEK